MDPLDVNTILGIAIAYIVMMAAKRIGKSKFWTSVKKEAKDDLENPNSPTVDPVEAVEKALVAKQQPSIRRVADSIAPINIPRTSTQKGIKAPEE